MTTNQWVAIRWKGNQFEREKERNGERVPNFSAKFGTLSPFLSFSQVMLMTSFRVESTG
jgi:hypothetical protein